MKAWLRGRALDVDLEAGQQQVIAQLVSLGLQGEHVEAIADIALRYAREETELLARQLTPPSQWPGVVVCRRFYSEGGTPTWLMLKRADEGWRLDAALFD